MRIWTGPSVFAALLMTGALMITSCAPTTSAGTETERTILRGYEEAMPSRSRQDTAQTQAEIGKLYDLHCRLMKGAGLASAYCAVR